MRSWPSSVGIRRFAAWPDGRRPDILYLNPAGEAGSTGVSLGRLGLHGVSPTTALRPGALHPRGEVGAAPLGVRGGGLASHLRRRGGSGSSQSARRGRTEADRGLGATRACPSVVRWMRSSAHMRQSRSERMPHRSST